MVITVGYFLHHMVLKSVVSGRIDLCCVDGGGLGMNVYLACCLAGVGGIGKRGDFWVSCGDMQGGSSFCASV